MNITYLFHSGFMVELENNILIFDYFKDNCKKNIYKECGQIKPSDLSLNKNIYFFVSHDHYDHYDKEIFLFNSKKVHYVFFDELKYCNDLYNVYNMKAYQSVDIGDVKVSTYGSTDEGISFMVNVESKTLFHAGDLNWWHWEGETYDEKQNAKRNFIEEINKIKERNIDIAFFPVDPRLEDSYYMGAEYFIDIINPKIFIPMHFQDVYSVTEKFENYIKSKTNTKIILIHKRGELLYQD